MTLKQYPASCTVRVHQRSMFRTKLQIKVQKAGFQNREDGALLKKGGSASVHDYVHANRTLQVRFIFDVE